MTTTVQEPAMAEEAPPVDVAQVLVHVPGDGGEMETMTVLEAGTELAALGDDVEMARAILKRASALEDALVLVVPLNASLHIPGDRAWTLVQPEGSREVNVGVFNLNRDRLVAMGLAEKKDPPPPEPVYEHGGVKALTTAAALAALQAAGIEGLVGHKQGRKQLVLTQGVPAPTNEEASNGR